jgi:AraC-like DNA-binding protein
MSKTPNAKPSQWTISSTWMRGVRDLLQEAQLDVAALFAEVGLDSKALNDLDARFGVERVDALWALAAQQSGQPFIALRPRLADDPASFDVLAYAMMSCQNLRESLVRIAQYRGIVSDAVDLGLSDVVGGLRIEVRPLEPLIPGRNARVDYTIITFLAFCRWVTGRKISPLAVELPYAAPEERSLHGHAFNCEPLFGSAQHALTLRTDDVRSPLPTANGALSRIHDGVVRERLSQLVADTVQTRVTKSLMQHIARGRVTRERVAADLCMSDRTLQRRLVDAGTSFNKEVDTLRLQLASTYLQGDSVPLSSIPYLLGFQDESSFFRACRRWFQVSPGQYRAAWQSATVSDYAELPRT